MIQSLFIISPNGEVLIEKHWRKVTSRSVVDLFLEHVNSCEDAYDVLPLLATSSHYLMNVYKNKLFFVCVAVDEVSPSLVFEFLHRVVDILETYFSQVNEASIKENFSTVYQLLEEMCDNGFPLITEPNALLEMIAPPSIQNRIVAAVSGKSSVADVLPDGAISSSIPWRKKGVHYSVNSIYFDIIEEIDCIIARNGQVANCDVYGKLTCRSNLSGMPDLLVSFHDPFVMQDFSLHPCIRVSRFEQERMLSFIPPDGRFTMMTYKVDPELYSSANPSSNKRMYTNLPIPVYCRPQITFGDVEGHVEVLVGSKSVGKSGKAEFLQAEDVTVIIPFPRTIRSTDLKCNIGTVLCDEITKECQWKIGRIPKDSTPKLTGSFAFVPNTPKPDDTITVLLEFKCPDTSVSNLQVSEISLLHESYDPYKYVRSTLCSGKIQIRCP